VRSLPAFGLRCCARRAGHWMPLLGLQSQLQGVASVFVVAVAGPGLAEASPPGPAQMVLRGGPVRAENQADEAADLRDGQGYQVALS
jgi:hypothetical protein